MTAKTFSMGATGAMALYAAVLASGVGGLELGPSAFGQASFQGLDNLPGGRFGSTAWGISADGEVLFASGTWMEPTFGCSGVWNASTEGRIP